jgi:glyoxylase-like metal-dependent hydrolase (beta-lactamase superfamily II)
MKLKKLADGIFYSLPEQELDQPCLYAVVGRDRTLMIDGGVSQEKSRQFIELVKLETGRGVDFVAVTHWHWDHTFGLSGISAPVIACANTAAQLRRLKSYASWSDEALDARMLSGEEITACSYHIKKVYPGDTRNAIAIRLPDIVFEGSLSIDLGGVACNLEMLPRVHTDDSVAIHVPQRRVLFIGDSTGQNSYAQPAHYSAPAVLELMDFIREKDASVIAESHAGPQSPAEFWAGNGILETAANGILLGLHDRHSLMDYLLHNGTGSLPGDVDEIVELFLNGIGR